MLAAIVNATATIGTLGLTTGGGCPTTGVAAWAAIIFIISHRGRSSNRRRGRPFRFKRGLARIFFRLQTGRFCRFFFSAAVFFSATTFFIAIGLARLFFAAAGFFQRGETGLFGFAQQLGLQFLTRQLRLRRWGGLRRRRRLSSGCRSDRRRFRLRRSGGRCRNLCRLLRFTLAWFPQNAATLYFHHNGV